MTTSRQHSEAWHDNPLELDRTLEDQHAPDELSVEEAAARQAAIAADPSLAARRDFLSGLAAQGALYREGLVASTPVGLEARVLETLATSTGKGRTRFLRTALAAAAVLLVGLTASLLDWGGDSAAVAMPAAVIHAAEAARSPDAGPRGCESPAEQSPLRFPPVRDGSLLLYACVEKDGSTVAKLQRPEELPSIGYAAVPAAGVSPGPTVGRTSLGDTVVFDITYGRAVHYLAVRTAWLERQRVLTPGRESCRACHHLSRVGQDNPHRIIERSWRLAGD